MTDDWETKLGYMLPEDLLPSGKGASLNLENILTLLFKVSCGIFFSWLYQLGINVKEI